MIDTLFQLFHKVHAVEGVTLVLTKIKELLDLLEKDYLKDGNAKNAAIDAIKEILEGCKLPEDVE